MRKKIDAGISALCVFGMLVLPVLRSGNLPQLWERILQTDLTGIGLRSVLGFFVLGVQLLPAFWFSCFAKHYMSNMLIMAALALLAVTVRRLVQREVGEEG